MIVRILTEGQYEITGDLLEELDREDNRLLEAIANSDEEAFRRELETVLAIVRRGRRLADDELVESDLILPAPDTELTEALHLFADYPADLT
ncbi:MULTISPECIES: PspA-associated protein PspAA [Limnochorda]|uniref:PspA-associated protein PspAA n=1 Tax=Limnochorda TaxID=1676651 RepID=UPI0017C6CBF9|nr:hypothetical protein [Limnochorda pilosa]MBO2487172.1 hypothetical protein [Bacillota bacterium]MBO2520087.1 hypothetical protein [Bacillota bacterium]NMA71589.1 hypothetical protein [Bacillota bacterium]